MELRRELGSFCNGESAFAPERARCQVGFGRACMSEVNLTVFFCLPDTDPAEPLTKARRGISRFPRKECLHMPTS
jgi:hypothetical protein